MVGPLWSSRMKIKKNILLHFYFIQSGENIMSKRKYTYKMEEVVCQTCLNRRVFYKHNHDNNLDSCMQQESLDK